MVRRRAALLVLAALVTTLLPIRPALAADHIVEVRLPPRGEPHCLVRIRARLRVGSGADLEAANAQARADVDRVRTALLRAWNGSDDMKTKVAEGCGQHQNVLLITVVRDKASVRNGHVDETRDGRVTNHINIDVGDVDRVASSAEGPADAVQRVADDYLEALLAHEIDHTRDRQGHPHRDPEGRAARRTTGPAVDDENKVRAQLGSSVQRKAYKGSRAHTIEYEVDTATVILRTDRANRPGPRGRRGFLPEEDPAEGVGFDPDVIDSLPDRSCGSPEEIEEGGCYPPAFHDDEDLDGVTDGQDNCAGITNPWQADADDDGTGGACDADDDGDGWHGSLEHGLGARDYDPESVPESWLYPGGCADGRDGDGDGFADAADAGCIPPAASASPPLLAIDGGPLADHHRLVAGGVQDGMDAVGIAMTGALDVDGDGEADDEVELDGVLVVQRQRADEGGIGLELVALALDGERAEGDPIQVRLSEGTGRLDRGNGAAFFPAGLSVAGLVGEVDAWPPFGASLELSNSLRTETGGELVGGTVSVTQPPAAPETAVDAIRHAGPDRFSTAGALALAAFPDGAEVVLLARGDAFPDALSGAYLAGVRQAAVLLTGTAQVPVATLAALERLVPQLVVLLGGPSAISVEVEEMLAASGYEVVRLSGDDRYATMAAVINAANTPAPMVSLLDGPELPTAFVASGERFPDALAAGAYAYSGAIPLLLTAHDGLPAPTRELLASLEIGQVVIVGGPVAVSDAVSDELRELGIRVVRIQGADRTRTAVGVANVVGEALGLVPAAATLATGGSFPDALALAPLAGSLGAPILLTAAAHLLSPQTVEYLGEHCADLASVVVAGGRSVVTEPARFAARAAATCLG